jgi:hypothetical protein
VSPLDLEQCHPDVLFTMVAYLNWRTERQAKAAKQASRRR